MQRKFTLVAAVVSTLAVAAPALAKDSIFEVSSRIVHYDDLNLASERGRKLLEARVRAAANGVCGMREAHTLHEQSVALSCRAAALAKAQPKVAEAVSKAGARYAGRSGE